MMRMFHIQRYSNNRGFILGPYLEEHFGVGGDMNTHYKANFYEVVYAVLTLSGIA